MTKISQWYIVLGHHTFPTLFVKMTDEQYKLFSNLDKNFSAIDLRENPVLALLETFCQEAMNKFFGKSFVGLDSCSPNDVVDFVHYRNNASALQALQLLRKSAKVIKALEEGERVIIFRPYRRMNRIREFRLFIRGKKLVGMSQYCLERHFRRLEGHKEDFLEIGKKFIAEIAEFLPLQDLVIDVYLTSKKSILIIDINNWGEPTNALLFKWTHQWKEEGEIRLIKPPTKMIGDIKITY